MLEAIGQNKHVQRLCNEHIAAQDQLYTVLIQKPSFDMTTGDIIYSSYSFVIYIPLHFLLSVWMQKAVDKMLAFDVSKGDLSLFFQDIFSSESWKPQRWPLNAYIRFHKDSFILFSFDFWFFYFLHENLRFSSQKSFPSQLAGEMEHMDSVKKILI